MKKRFKVWAGKTVYFLVVLAMVLQPVSSPGILKAIAADETGTAAVSENVSGPKEEPKEELKSETKAETPAEDSAPDSTNSISSPQASSSQAAPKEEPQAEAPADIEDVAEVADSVSETTETSEETAPESQNAENTDSSTKAEAPENGIPTLTEQPIDGAITSEAAAVEAPAEEVAVEAPKVEVKKDIWSVDGDKATTNDPVELNVKYTSPQNEDVSVTFTKLPENPGMLSIEEVTLTKEQVLELNALSNKAYDITSTMKDGTFEYDLSLPKPEGEKNAQIKFAEDIKDLEEAEAVSVVDADENGDSIRTTLNHFTIFIVAADLSVVPTLNHVSQVTVAPGTAILATLQVSTALILNDWESSAYRIEGGSWICVNTPNHLNSGTHTESFSITAPMALGTYDVAFRAYGGAGCSGIYDTQTLCDGIVVNGPVADLVVSKTNNLEGNPALAGGTFNWILSIINSGTANANFSDGQIIVRDNMPDIGVDHYGTAVVSSGSGVTGDISCSQSGTDGRDLVCSADGAVVIPAGGTIEITIPVNPNYFLAGLSLNNPRVGGSCKADPNNNIIEGDDNNNNCANSVNIVLPGSIDAFKFNDENGNGFWEFWHPFHESGMAGWEMNLYAGYGCGGTPVEQKPTLGDWDADFTNLLPGHYSVSETQQNGWGGTTPACVNVNLLPGDHDHVYFGNRQVYGSISGQKYNDINGNGVRDAEEYGLENWTVELYNETGNGLLDSATTDGDGNYSFSNIIAGNYQVCEINQSGWNNTDPGAGVASTACKSVTVSALQDSTVDFGNQQMGRILVNKITNPADSQQLFDFHASWDAPEVNFQVGSGGTGDSGYLTPGNYSVSEINMPAGWDLSNAECTSGGGENNIEAARALAEIQEEAESFSPDNISLNPGETVTCTFTNTQRGTITISKHTDRATDKTFEFFRSYGADVSLASGESNNSGYLAAGTYTVEENLNHEWWDLNEISCVDNSQNSTFAVSGAQATISLVPGANVVCVFANSYHNHGDDGSDGGGTSFVPSGTITGLLTGTAGAGNAGGEAAAAGVEAAPGEGGQVEGAETEVAGAETRCNEWPLWVWILIMLAYLGLFDFSSFYKYKQDKNLRWIWQAVELAAVLAIWYFYDVCRLHLWFPWVALIGGIVMYVMYLNLRKKAEPEVK